MAPQKVQAPSLSRKRRMSLLVLLQSYTLPQHRQLATLRSTAAMRSSLLRLPLAAAPAAALVAARGARPPCLNMPKAFSGCLLLPAAVGGALGSVRQDGQCCTLVVIIVWVRF